MFYTSVLKRKRFFNFLGKESVMLALTRKDMESIDLILVSEDGKEKYLGRITVHRSEGRIKILSELIDEVRILRSELFDKIQKEKSNVN